MSTITIGEIVIEMSDAQRDVLLLNKTIKLVEAESYRPASYVEMFGEAGSPIRAPECLPDVFAAEVLLSTTSTDFSPVNITPPSITGSEQVDETLTAFPVTWSTLACSSVTES